jgi:ATP-grasp domain, R2K clade family 3
MRRDVAVIGPGEELLLVDETLWLLRSEAGLPAYDFPIDRFFPCRRPWQRPLEVEIVGRVGAFEDYPARFEDLLGSGMRLVHTPEEHRRCSDLTQWYPLIEALTPRSVWFDEAPEAGEIGRTLGWPVFVKGARQTSRHRRSLSIIDGPAAFSAAMEAYRADPILRWQRVVCREFMPLRPVEDPAPDRIPSSFEFRTFWWRGQLAGYGPYWWEGLRYRACEEEREAGLSVAREAAARLDVAFLVVDIALALDGRWIVIECNDGQESGYAGVSPLGLWQSILGIERGGPKGLGVHPS